jgi:hypothetical protein
MSVAHSVDNTSTTERDPAGLTAVAKPAPKHMNPKPIRQVRVFNVTFLITIAILLAALIWKLSY